MLLFNKAISICQPTCFFIFHGTTIELIAQKDFKTLEFHEYNKTAESFV